jgi:hypothetical protein
MSPEFEAAIEMTREALVHLNLSTDEIHRVTTTARTISQRLTLAALPTLRPCWPADFYCRRFDRGCRGGLFLPLTFEFGATTGINGQPPEAKDNSDHEHQHKDLICGHTPSFFISLNVEWLGENVLRRSALGTRIGRQERVDPCRWSSETGPAVADRAAAVGSRDGGLELV